MSDFSASGMLVDCPLIREITLEITENFKKKKETIRNHNVRGGCRGECKDIL